MDFLPFSRPSLGEDELSAVRDVFESGWITTGPKNAELEESFCKLTGNKHAIAVCSATAGMHITLIALGIGPGDEVITPSMTWVSTINLITLLGATPVMIDVDRETLMVTPELISAAITSKTRAIIPVHYAGVPFDVDEIHRLASKHGIPVIEDAAHAAGCFYKGKHVGFRGTAIFSFHAIKNMTCAEGGMIVTDNDEVANKVRSLKFHGLGMDSYDRTTFGRKPQAEVILPGYKYNLTDISAAIALVQLAKLPEINKRRAEIANKYIESFRNLPFKALKIPSWPHQHGWHLFIIRTDEETCGVTRDQLMEGLKERGIGTGLHFRAAHTHKFYREHLPGIVLPNTEWNNSRICSLPLYHDMSDADVERVVYALKEIATN